MQASKVQRVFTDRVARGFSRITVFVLICLLAGCISHVKQLRDAQEEFNKAAALENEIRLNPKMGNAVNLGGVNASYRLALGMIAELIEKEKGDLEEDQLIGVAYSLKALAEWRLGEYAAAVTTMETAEQYPQNMLLPRDRALFAALRGLIKNSQAYNHMVNRDYPYEDIKRLLKDSVEDIQIGMMVQDAGENLRLYLITAKLAVLKNWVDLNGDRHISRPASFDESAAKEEWCDLTQPVWAAFVDEIEKTGTPEGGAFQEWWAKRLGMPGACR